MPPLVKQFGKASPNLTARRSATRFQAANSFSAHEVTAALVVSRLDRRRGVAGAVAAILKGGADER